MIYNRKQLLNLTLGLFTGLNNDKAEHLVPKPEQIRTSIWKGPSRSNPYFIGLSQNFPFVAFAEFHSESRPSSGLALPVVQAVVLVSLGTLGMRWPLDRLREPANRYASSQVALPSHDSASRKLPMCPTVYVRATRRLSDDQTWHQSVQQTSGGTETVFIENS